MVMYPRIGLNWLLYRYYRWGKTEPPTSRLEDHVFKSLDRSKREIRLLKIPRLFLGEYKQYGRMRDFRPGNCELHRLSLDDKNLQPYECISYHWGNGEKEWNVQVDGQCMKVSEVVYTILCERRSLVKDRWIWIDQICIYSYRTAMKHLENLRFMPQFSEGFDFVSERKYYAPCFSR